MKKRTKGRSDLVAAAMAGLLAGAPLAGCGENQSAAPKTPAGAPAVAPKAMEATPPQPMPSTLATPSAIVDEHSCAGKNACKGLGGCGSGDNGCAGKNSCKGKGGCGTAMRK
jgi:hypothetical protein